MSVQLWESALLPNAIESKPPLTQFSEPLGSFTEFELRSWQKVSEKKTKYDNFRQIKSNRWYVYRSREVRTQYRTNMTIVSGIPKPSVL
jgi:hypothetical protein